MTQVIHIYTHTQYQHRITSTTYSKHLIQILLMHRSMLDVTLSYLYSLTDGYQRKIWPWLQIIFVICNCCYQFEKNIPAWSELLGANVVTLLLWRKPLCQGLVKDLSLTGLCLPSRVRTGQCRARLGYVLISVDFPEWTHTQHYCFGLASLPAACLVISLF